MDVRERFRAGRVIGISTLIIACAATCGPAAASSGPTWRVQTVRPPSYRSLDSVSCWSAGSCLAVGSDNGAAVVQRGIGGHWTPIHVSPDTPRRSVSCRGAWCLLTGYGTYIRRAERWDPAGWKTYPLYDPNGVYGDDLSSVSCASRHACVAVGSTSVFTRLDCPPSPITPVCTTGIAYVQRFNGRRWKLQQVPQPVTAIQSVPRGGNGPYVALDAVSCPAAGACMAIGEWGLPAQANVIHLFADRLSGSHWSLRRIPSPPGRSDADLSSISCASARACTAVGDSGSYGGHPPIPLVARWNGRAWTVRRGATPPGAKGASLEAVSCTAATTCTAVGHSESRDGRSRPLAERLVGTRATIEPTPTPPHSRARGGSGFTSISCPTTTSCTASGDYDGPRQGWFVEAY